MKVIDCTLGQYLSDHRIVCATLSLLKPPSERKPLTVRNIKNVSQDSLISNFNADNIPNTDNLVNHFNIVMQ